MTTFREKNPPGLAGFPTLPTNLGQMVGSSGPGDGTGGHDAAKLLVTIMANAANIGIQETKALEDAGANDIDPLFNPASTAQAALAAYSDFGHIDRPVDTFQSDEAVEARRQADARKSSPKMTG